MSKPFLCRPKTRSEIKRICVDCVRVVGGGSFRFSFSAPRGLPDIFCTVLGPQRCFQTGNNSKMNNKQKQQQKIPEWQKGLISKKA